MRLIVDFIAAIIQAYFVAKIVCIVLRVKEPKEKSFLLACVQMLAGYIVVNFIFTGADAVNIVWERVISGIITYILFGFLFYEGNIFYKIFAAVAQYAGMFLVDIGIQLLLFTDFMAVIKVLPVFEMTLLGRGLVTSFFFLLCVLVELYDEWKKSSNIFITILAVALAFVQLICLNTLSKANPNGMLNSRVMITVFFHLMLTIGYIVGMELFKKVEKNQNKKNELEQIDLEIRYQKDYYQKLLQQNEELRNLRHDMKNCLQTIEILADTKQTEDREKAIQILNAMKNQK